MLQLTLKHQRNIQMKKITIYMSECGSQRAHFVLRQKKKYLKELLYR